MCRVKVVSALLVISLCTCYVAAQTGEQQIRDGFAVEVELPALSPDKVPLYAPTLIRSGPSGQILAVVKAVGQPETLAFLVTIWPESDSVKIEVTPIPSRPAEAYSPQELRKPKQGFIASGSGRYGEVIRLAEVTKVGTPPLEVRVVRRAVRILPRRIHFSN